jgi:hypothetical protein
MSTATFNTWLNPNGTENYKCRAWVNFNGVTTATIRASGNVSSVTRNGTGDYTVNFTTAMPDANYSTVGTCNLDATTNFNRILSAPARSAPTTTNIRFLTGLGATGAEDMQFVNVAIFR